MLIVPLAKSMLISMARFIPHFLIFGAALLFVVIGIAIDSGGAGRVIGAVVASIKDPYLFVLAIIVGAVFRRALLPIALVLVGVAVAYYVTQFVWPGLAARSGPDVSSRLPLLYGAKIVASLLAGYSVNLFRLILD